jgi:hypothetical protein
MQSGVHKVDVGLFVRIKAEHGGSIKVVGTGGLGRPFSRGDVGGFAGILALNLASRHTSSRNCASPATCHIRALCGIERMHYFKTLLLNAFLGAGGECPLRHKKHQRAQNERSHRDLHEGEQSKKAP